MAVPLYTIGYQGARTPAFIARLRDIPVRVLIDVRAVPASRNPDFAKSRLRALLAEGGIDYRHLPALGNPKPGRDAARGGDRDRYRAIYQAQLDSPDGRAGLADAAAIASEAAACLMCLERDPAHCHRTMVAERLAERGFDIVNLFVDPQLNLNLT